MYTTRIVHCPLPVTYFGELSDVAIHGVLPFRCTDRNDGRIATRTSHISMAC